MTVQGSGADIWGTADGCEFFGTTVVGDGELVARVDSLSVTDAWAKAGVMLRASTAPGAVQAFACLTPGNGVAYQRRYLSGGPSSGTAGAAVAAPYRVKLVRTGSTIQAYQASDGATWVLIRSDTVDFAATVLVGLAVTTHSDGRSATGVFSHIGSTFAPVAAN